MREAWLGTDSCRRPSTEKIHRQAYRTAFRCFRPAQGRCRTTFSGRMVQGAYHNRVDDCIESRDAVTPRRRPRFVLYQLMSLSGVVTVECPPLVRTRNIFLSAQQRSTLAGVHTGNACRRMVIKIQAGHAPEYIAVIPGILQLEFDSWFQSQGLKAKAARKEMKGS